MRKANRHDSVDEEELEEKETMLKERENEEKKSVWAVRITKVWVIDEKKKKGNHREQ